MVWSNPRSRWRPLHAPIPVPHSEKASLGKAGTGAQEPGLAQLLTGCFLQSSGTRTLGDALALALEPGSGTHTLCLLGLAKLVGSQFKCFKASKMHYIQRIFLPFITSWFLILQ